MPQESIAARPAHWKTRLADSIAAGFVGWCLFQKVLPSMSQLERSLLVVLLSMAFTLLGLFLPDIFSWLDRKGIPARSAALAARLIAAGAVGSYALSMFVEGCASGLAVICFGAFLWLLFRALDDSRQSLVSSASGSIPARRSALAPRVSGKLQDLFVMAASGTITGFLAGAVRAAIGVQNLTAHTAIFCLFPLSVIVLGVVMRLLSAGWIQGRDHLRGWKAVFAIADGLIVGALLAIATCGELPAAISWSGTISKNQLLWIPLGLALGFTWGVVFGSAKKLASSALKGLLKSKEYGEAATDARHEKHRLNVDSPRLGDVKALRSGEEKAPPPRNEPSPASSKRTPPCSCLLAGSALAASILFGLMSSMGIWKSVDSRGDLGRLPQGCPKACAGAELDRFKLAGIDLSGANLSRAKLRDAELEGANLRDAILRDALLFRADLRDADLSGADLSGADLRRTILLKARFTKTRLRGAYLRNATLQDLDLSTADLQGADLRDAAYSKKTVWPPGFDIREAGLHLDE